MSAEKKQRSRFIIITCILLALTVVLGRLVTHLTAVTATDIAYPDWIPSALGWAGEIITVLRTVVSFSAAAAAYYFSSTALAVTSLCVSALFSLLDYAARFFIDLLSSSLTGMEMMALIWLLMQFLYELVFMVLAFLIICMIKKKSAAAENRRTREKCSSISALRASLILVLLFRILLELIYLIDFVTSYTGITTAEIASMIGQFIRIIVIHGGAALIIGELVHPKHSALLRVPENDAE